MKKQYKKKTIVLLSVSLLFTSNLSSALATTVKENNKNVVSTEELNHSVDGVIPQNNIIDDVGVYFYTVDNSQPKLETGWSLSRYKYPEGFESGTLTYDELVDGLIGHLVMGLGITSSFKDTIYYISKVTNGQMTLEEFKVKTGYELTSGDLEQLNPYMGYSLYEGSYANNLSQLVTQTDPSVKVQLGIPFVKNDSKTTIHYIMEDGTPAFEDRVITGAKGITPDSLVESPLKEGYVADKPSVLVHMDGEQEITVIYKAPPIKGENVIAKYVDENNNTISEDIVKLGNIGENYLTEQKDIEGYTFKEVQGNPSGQFTDQAQTVTYVYTKNEILNITGTVFVEYIDIDGNKISEDIVKSGTVGEVYSTEKKAIDGYAFKEVQGSTTGQFTEQVQTVTYVYTKNKLNPVNPEPNPEKKPNSKDKSNNKGTTSSTQHGLPATGENERITMMSIILGLILLALGVAVSIFRIKKVNK
ncbi:MucBP domain-containing protein (plasmid) [Lactococcus garvieae]|uniref:MucBP domain-containing protein n=1 Tax=Lactococcus garvieae TaxID=1363 RepID=UPI0030CF95A9